MSKKVWLALVTVAALVFLLLIGVKASAWTAFRTGNNATVAAGETVDSTLWVGAKNVDIAGTVNGDVFCGAQTVNISGTVKGDVICGAQTINISGNVEGNVRLGAQTVNITGTIARSATIGAQTINTDSKSRIGIDASFGASDMNLNGAIGRDLAAGGTTLSLNGEVGRDIKSQVSQITLDGSAKVGGGIDYTSKNKISLAGGAQVLGKVTQHVPKEGVHHFRKFVVFTGWLIFWVSLVMLITAWVITALLPKVVHSVSGQGMRRPWRALLTGFVASIVVPVLAVLLMITVIGIPLGLLLLLCWILIATLSGVFSAYYLGRRIWSNQKNPLWIILLGGVILLALYMIPIVGFIILLLAFWLGAGMELLELKNRVPAPKYHLE